MMIKIIITVENDTQKEQILSALQVGEADGFLDFSFGVISEHIGVKNVVLPTGAPDETPGPMPDFAGWYDTLPEGTRTAIEDSSLFTLMQTSFLQGKRKLRHDNHERMTNIVNQLNTALHLLGELS